MSSKIYVPKHRRGFSVRWIYCKDCDQIVEYVFYRGTDFGAPAVREAIRRHKKETSHNDYYVGDRRPAEKD